MLQNAGPQRPAIAEGLLGTVAWRRDGLGVIEVAADTEPLAASLESNDGVYFVPALTGLGSPCWDPYARGTIVGLTRGSTRAHLARAALEAIAYQAVDAVRAMEAAGGTELTELRADGGATVNAWLMQFQADVLGVPVSVPEIPETTALGAASLTGVGPSAARGVERRRSLPGVALADSNGPLDIDLLAASLRADEAELGSFVEAVAAKLEAAMPGAVRAQRGRDGLFGAKRVQRVTVDAGGRRLELRRAGTGIETTCSRMSGGIVLKSEAVDIGTWLAALGEAVADEARRSETAREALERLLNE